MAAGAPWGAWVVGSSCADREGSGVGSKGVAGALGGREWVSVTLVGVVGVSDGAWTARAWLVGGVEGWGAGEGAGLTGTTLCCMGGLWSALRREGAPLACRW